MYERSARAHHERVVERVQQGDHNGIAFHFCRNLRTSLATVFSAEPLKIHIPNFHEFSRFQDFSFFSNTNFKNL